jgi:hypothetical protein
MNEIFWSFSVSTDRPKTKLDYFVSNPTLSNQILSNPTHIFIPQSLTKQRTDGAA